MENKDIRWVQRFSNYIKALKQLKKAVTLASERELTELEQQGLLQGFEFTHELAWVTLKDFLEYRGNKDIYGSRDATRLAFKLGIIEDGETWMGMIESRNKTTHTYNEETATEIAKEVRLKYYSEFVMLEEKLTELKNRG